MKLLYISSYHSSLEYDHLTVFSELGIDWFSTGVYADPLKPDPTNDWKGPIQRKVDPKLYTEFSDLNPNHRSYSKIKLTKGFVDQFDLVLCSFSFPVQSILDDVWEVCKHKPFIYHTYSQQFKEMEYKLQSYKKKGIYLVRGSSNESTIENYAGHDEIIRCWVDVDKFSSWSGHIHRILTFANDWRSRINHPNFECYRSYYKYIKPNFPCTLFGRDSICAGGQGFISTDQQINEYRNHRLYFALSSPPSSHTYNFMEAFSTGIPVITFGSKLGNGVDYNTWEVPKFIENGVNGFYSDNLVEIAKWCNMLLKDHSFAETIGKAGRETCISLFSKETVKQQWKRFFNRLGFIDV